MTAATTSLTIRHVAIGKEVSIPISVTNFIQDTLPTFSSSPVYGRMDPIFTYQGTTRTFQFSAQTALWSEFGDMNASSVTMPLAANQKLAKAALTAENETQENLYKGIIAQKMSAIYQMMYPVYEAKTSPRTFQLKGPPILKIQINNIFGQANGDGETSFVFVPESFSLSSGHADATKSQIIMSGPSDRKYLVPQGSFGFTLGGTILHVDKPPGFIQTADGIAFTQDSFPLGTVAEYSSDEEEILK
jgi:hypothetical protein